MAFSRLAHSRWQGVDENAESLAFAQGLNLGPRVGLCRGDVCWLPYPDEHFDKALLVELLEHLEDDLSGLLEVWRVLKPNGLLAVSVPHRKYPFLFDPVNWIWERLWGRPIRTGPLAGIWTDHCRLYDRQGLQKLAERAGFEVLDCHLLTHYCLPFTHNLVYGVGKGLLLNRRLPGWILNEVDRFHPETGRRHPLNPMSWIMRAVERIDRLNTASLDKSAFVNVAIKARKVQRSRSEVTG
jgi:SAM-dependent methyltransferase